MSNKIQRYFEKDNGIRLPVDDKYLQPFLSPTAKNTHFRESPPASEISERQKGRVLLQIHQMLKYVKFGFGQCADHASFDIRDGLLTRDKAIELVKRYDGQCGARFIKEFCDYIEISIDEFWRVADSFRGPMWEKNSKDEWVLKDSIWEQQEKIKVDG